MCDLFLNFKGEISGFQLFFLSFIRCVSASLFLKPKNQQSHVALSIGSISLFTFHLFAFKFTPNFSTLLVNWSSCDFTVKNQVDRKWRFAANLSNLHVFKATATCFFCLPAVFMQDRFLSRLCIFLCHLYLKCWTNCNLHKKCFWSDRTEHLLITTILVKSLEDLKF